MGHVIHVRVHREQARRGSIGIPRIAGQDQMYLKVQDAAVAPIARMEFLAIDDPGLVAPAFTGRSFMPHVWKALLFVDHEVVHQVQVFASGLTFESIPFISVCSGVVSVHMEVCTCPFTAALIQACKRSSVEVFIGSLWRDVDGAGFGMVCESTHDGYGDGSDRNV